MIRLQVEAHVGAVTNPEVVKQAGYAVAIQSRKARATPSASSVNACGHTGTPGSAPTHHCWASPKPASKRPSPNHPLLLPAATPARTLTQYALMLRGQRFTLLPGSDHL